MKCVCGYEGGRGRSGQKCNLLFKWRYFLKRVHIKETREIKKAWLISTYVLYGCYLSIKIAPQAFLPLVSCLC